MQKVKIYVLVVVITTANCLLTSIAKASSSYDNAYRTTTSLYASGASCNLQDISLAYATYILDPSKWVLPSSVMQPVKSSYESALEDGRIGVSMRTNYGQSQSSTVNREVFIFWNENDELGVQWWGDDNVAALARNYVSVTCLDSVAGGYGKVGVAGVVLGSANFNAVPISNSLANTFSPYAAVDRSLFIDASAFNYPVGYEGEPILTSDSQNDSDGDGLNANREALQGTLDSTKDTDGDGLSDYTESVWFSNRQGVFCGNSCAYPNPTAKDLYVEVDWMKNGDRVMKPSTAQLNTVVTAFANKGIIAHFDTGQFGGGNELPAYANELYFEPDSNNLDFFDLKNGNSSYAANFNPDRDYIWHYMISGNRTKFWDSKANQWVTDSSGVSYSGDDDLFVSVGHIEDDQASFNYSSLDTALSGTIIHEIGHNICLSSDSYTGQSTGCQFDKIDTWAGQSYGSSMNYTKQMSQVDYSTGANGSPNDHDDWTAVLDGGLKDFTDPTHNSGDSGVQNFFKKAKKKVVRGITSSEAKTLKKAGKLGKS